MQLIFKKLDNPDISLSDKDGTDSVIFGVYGIPESILVDKKHYIVKNLLAL